ncbi:MAG: glucose-6-phosphate isomerase [Deltaproteobacteria bacterium]|nr:glucose-6-phosphate isomerase [Deltaproteobacteria bacterium]
MADLNAWEKFCEYSYYYRSVGLRLDISSVDVTAEELRTVQDLGDKALDEMTRLEAGEICNSDENRMVGHFWLRNSLLAPNDFVGSEINQTLQAIKTYTCDFRAGKMKGCAGRPFTNILLVGIGGSALGPQLLADALGSSGNSVSIAFLDNTDPDGFWRTLSNIKDNIDQTLVIITSKSGGTIETRNGMVEVQAIFKEKGLDYAKNFVAITCQGSKLDDIAKSEKWSARFPLWDFIGGRFSVCSVVGLLPAGLLGIEIEDFLTGAKEMDQITRSVKGLDNPALAMALIWYLVGRGRGQKDLVVLPYKDRLVLFSKYLQQMVMESLGKRLDRNGQVVNQGLSVFGNKGSTDQHAYIQQLRDGLDNYFVTFIEVLADYTNNVQNITPVFVEPGITSGDYLNGFYQGTRRALQESGRQSITITIDKLSAFSLGSLIALFERTISFYASMININAYHQPGVEVGKIAATTVISIERNIQEFLAQAGDKYYTAMEIANGIGNQSEVVCVFKILERLSQNKFSKIINNGERQPELAAYKHI